MTTAPANLIEVLDERVQELFAAGQIEDALRITQTALDSARRAAHSDAINAPALITALEVMGDLHRAQGAFQNAEALYLEALEFFDHDSMPPEQEARIKSGLAALYDANHLPEKAAPLYENAIEIFQSLDDNSHDLQVAKLCNNVGMIYKDMGNHEMAEKKYVAAVGIFEQAKGKDSEEAATVYNNLGGLYALSGYPEQAREMHKIALDIRGRIFPSDDPELAQSLTNIATVYHELQEYKAAMVNYERALKIFEHNLPGESENYTIVASNLCTLLREQGLERKTLSLERHVNKMLKKASKRGR